MSGIEELVKRLRAPNYAIVASPQDALTASADALEAQAARVKELEALCERLKLEAQMHSGEARAHKSTVHECYRAVSGATGEPGNWHGATPVRERITELEATLKAFREAAKMVESSGWQEVGWIYQVAVSKASFDALMSALRM